MRVTRVGGLSVAAVVALLLGSVPASAGPKFNAPKPKFKESIAFDVSPTLRDLAKKDRIAPSSDPDTEFVDPRRDRGPVGIDDGFSGDVSESGEPVVGFAPTIAAPLANFEGLSNQANFNLFGFRVNPPDPVGDVGPNHYVQMVNLAYAVYDKQGNLLVGPVDTGTLWTGFSVPDCTDPSGDPVVLYDHFANRWLLTQFGES